MEYIATTKLQREQNKLSLNLIKYDLSSQWNSHRIIRDLRSRIYEFMPTGMFDPQDLEHQVLFRLTTFDPDTITDDIIHNVIDEQLAIINDRLSSVSSLLPDLFRGLTGHSKDLNRDKRLELKTINGALCAIGDGCSFEVEFKKIDDQSIIELFTEKLHYIHSPRHRGDVFGFFFKGDALPWGVETTEPSIIAKRYKRDALLAHGIDPNKAIEITRLYLLPGSPKNSISILDRLVSEYYKSQGIEAIYTTTMPTYAKTKGATTAGGMRDVLLVKEQSHTFRPIKIDDRVCYINDVDSKNSYADVITTHPSFPTLYTVETYMRLSKNRDINPLEVLKTKTLFVDRRSRRDGAVIREAKFQIKYIDECLGALNKNAIYKNTSYIYDQFWGFDDQPKLCLRRTYTEGKLEVNVSCKYRLSDKNYIRTEVTDIIYDGDNVEEALATIATRGRYKAENSYEKMRLSYQMNDILLRLDVYPFGAYLEVEGAHDAIWRAASILGFDQADSITKTADETYVEWNKNQGLDELWNVRFGLNIATEKRNEP